MRSAAFAAAFAAGVLAVPHQHRKRAVVTETDVNVVYVTDVVTVVAGQSTQEAAPAPAAAETPEPSSQDDWQHHHHHWWTSQWWHHPSPSTEEPAPAPTTVTSVYVPPPPPSSTPEPEPTSEPAPTSEAPAPTTYKPKPSPTPQPSPEPAPSPSSAPTSYNDKAKLHHNIHRSNHSAPDIEWDDGLAATAQKIGESCVYAHNTDMDGGGYGQNIAAGVEADNITAVITDLFYNPEVGYYRNLYGQDNPSMREFEAWGHFSQIVWASSTKFGCATVDCSAQGLGNVGSDVPPYFTVCNYSPPGNYGGQYGKNVGIGKGEPTAEWNYGL